MANSRQMPLRGPSAPEVPLPNAPLVSVIAQVRFPALLTVRNPDRVASFQEAIPQPVSFLTSSDRTFQQSGLWPGEWQT